MKKYPTAGAREILPCLGRIRGRRIWHDGREEQFLAGELHRGDETILVVEDDEGIRRFTVEIISKDGYKVFETHPGTPVPSAPYSPSFITTEGKHPRGSRGHDKGNRRSRGSCFLRIHQK
jgi:hypothetical protein